MKFYQITITSKNKHSLKNYFKFIIGNIKNFNLLNKFSQKKTKRIFFTMLKSPHVHKKAQEQFEFTHFSKQITISTQTNLKFLTFLKKIKTNLFSDVNIKIKFQLNKKLQNNFQKKFFNPNYFKLNCFNNKNEKKNYLLTKLQKIVKISDIYGELYQKNFNILFR